MKKLTLICICLICTALLLCACNNTANTAEEKTTSDTPIVTTDAKTPATDTVSDTGNAEATDIPTPDIAESNAPQSEPTGEQASAPTVESEITPSPEQPTNPSETETPAPVHKHSYTASVTPPSCTAQGYTTYTCSCGNSNRADTTAALGHQAGDWITTANAKVGVAGQRERRCTRCGSVVQTEAIPALRDPNSVTPEESARIIREVSAYAESYKAKGFTFEWLDTMEYGWDVGYMDTPRIRYEGIDGTIIELKHDVDLIVKTGTDPAYGLTSDRITYKVVQVTLDNGDIAFVVLYGG